MKQIILPKAYQIISYKPGFERDWARLECSAGDFESEKEAVDYFCNRYLSNNDRTDNLLFLTDYTGKVIGSCISWTDDRNGKMVNSLHWLIVDEEHQGKGLGRSLCIVAMNCFYQNGSEPIYIHTQPWSWKAILLYTSLGFRIQKVDTFGTYLNQYSEAMSTLKRVLSDEQYQKLEENAEE